MLVKQQDIHILMSYNFLKYVIKTDNFPNSNACVALYILLPIVSLED